MWILGFWVVVAAVLVVVARLVGRVPVAGGAGGPEGWIHQYPEQLHWVLKDVAGVQAWSFWAMVGLGDRLAYPRVREVTESPAGCLLTIGMLGGQSVSNWESALDTITQSLAVPEVVIKSASAGVIVLEVRITDPLIDAVEFPGPAALPDVDLEAVPVAVRESGAAWLLGVLYRHVLIAGATGAGKGSVLWSLLCGIAPAIHAGLVQVWAVDPKGGMELSLGERLFTRFVPGTGEPAVALLRELVELLEARTDRLRTGGVRKHVPTVDEPLIVLVLDEVAALIAYETDRKLRDEAIRLLSLLLSQGRAPAVAVIAAVQDPAKDTVPFRQLFPVRIGLRLDEPTQVNMVLGTGSKDRGAKCDSIPDTLPGVAYVAVEGETAIERVRMFYPTDAMIADVAAMYPAPKRGDGPDLQVVAS